MIETILPAWGSIAPSQISENVLRRAADRHEALRTVYADSGKRADPSVYLLQPESLMVFERLTTAPGRTFSSSGHGGCPCESSSDWAADFQLSLD